MNCKSEVLFPDNLIIPEWGNTEIYSLWDRKTQIWTHEDANTFAASSFCQYVSLLLVLTCLGLPQTHLGPFYGGHKSFVWIISISYLPIFVSTWLNKQLKKKY